MKKTEKDEGSRKEEEEMRTFIDPSAAEAREEEEKVNVYKLSFFDKIPYIVKALFFKFWVYGFVFFFIDMTLGEVISRIPDGWIWIHVIRGVALGAVVDLILNHFLPAFETNKKESRYYMMLKTNKFYSVFVNIIYCVVLSLFVGLSCGAMSNALAKALGKEVIFVFREPFTFAFVMLVFDAVLQTIKNVLVTMFKRLRKGRL